MDSISQFTLGASVGEAILGRKIGNKAILLGGLAGTLPDLDILFYPVLDDLAKITFHRGISHSIFFALVFAIPMAYLFRKWFKKTVPELNSWYLFFFLCFVTHPLLDCFTLYGTQLLLPFSDHPISFNAIFVADPLYTVPFLICVLACLFFNRTNNTRRIINFIGIGLSSSYLLFTVVNKFYIEEIFEEQFAKTGIEYTEMLTNPTPLNQVLWYAMFKTDSDRYYIGMYGHLDDDKEIDFYSIEGNHHLLDKIKNPEIKKTLKWFSNGYFAMEEKEDGIWLYDIRYGRMNVTGEENEFVFPFKINEFEDGTYTVKQVWDNRTEEDGSRFKELWERIKGNESYFSEAL